MLVLGIDHGSVRVGLAISDELGIFAMPLEVVPLASALTRIAELVQQRKIGMIVLGMPRNMDGSYGPKTEEVRRFAEKLKTKVSIEIRFWDERLTTLGAERALREADVSSKKRKEVIDQLAAQQILEGFLESLSAQGGVAGDSQEED